MHQQAWPLPPAAAEIRWCGWCGLWGRQAASPAGGASACVWTLPSSTAAWWGPECAVTKDGLVPFSLESRLSVTTEGEAKARGIGPGLGLPWRCWYSLCRRPALEIPASPTIYSPRGPGRAMWRQKGKWKEQTQNPGSDTWF